MNDAPLMPMATAVWLVENTTLTFKQIAEFCKLHEVEIQGIADGEVAKGIKPYNPIISGQLTKEEIELYGDRIINVHVKDRLLHGTTVPLGEGDADIATVLESLIRINYSGNYILQTARSKKNSHLEDLLHYRAQVNEWLRLPAYN